MAARLTQLQGPGLKAFRAKGFGFEDGCKVRSGGKNSRGSTRMVRGGGFEVEGFSWQLELGLRSVRTFVTRV